MRVSSESRQDADICDGDLLIVDSSVKTQDGHIVVVACLDSESTVKKLRRRHDRVRLPYRHGWNPLSELHMLGYQKTAIDCLQRGVILGANTKLETLTEAERRRHEAILARMAQKAALMRHKLPPELRDGEDDAAGAVAA